MLIKSIKLFKTEKGQPIKLDWAILRKLLPFLFAGCIRQSVIGLCSWRLRQSFSLLFLSVHFVYMSWIMFYFTLSFRNVYINKMSFFFFNWPFWFFQTSGKKNRIKNKPSKQSILLITRRKHPPPQTHTHLTWSHYSSHHSWPGRGNEGGPKGSSGVAWQCAQTCYILSVCYKALWVINSNQRNPFPICNLIGLPQL